MEPNGEWNQKAEGNPMVLIMDDQGIIIQINKKFEEFTAKKANELIGKSFGLMDYGWEYMSLDRMRELLSVHDVWRGEVPIPNQNGDLILCSVTLCPIADSVQNRVNIIAILDDISVKKEKELEHLRLKRMLSEQEKMATIGSMLTGIIHEINNPLSYVDTNLLVLEGIMKDIGLPDSEEAFEIEDIMSDMKKGIHHMKAISASLKRMAFRGLHEDKEYFDVNEEIETVISVAKNEFKYYAAVEFIKEANLMMEGYPGSVRQVFLNLLINAVYAIRNKNEHQLGLIVIHSRKEEGTIVVTVKDNGGGIPKNVQPHIFEPFYTTKKTGEGTGLGLSISKQIVEEKHGGSISFESTEGDGTTFTVRFNENLEAEDEAFLL